MPKAKWEDVYTGFRHVKAGREQSGWDGNAERSWNFIWGNQWPGDVKGRLHSQDRAALVHNLVLAVRDLLVGHMLQNAMNLVAVPVDEQADPYIAKFFTKIIKHIETNNDIITERQNQFVDGLATGVGIKEKWWDANKNIKGEIICQHSPSDMYYLDANFRRSDYGDASELYKVLWLSKDQIAHIYGKRVAKKLKFPSDETKTEYPSFTVVADNANQVTDYGNIAGTMTPTSFDGMANDAGYDNDRKLYRVIEQYKRIYVTDELYTDPETGEYLDATALSDEEYEFVKGMTIKHEHSVIHLTTIVGEEVVVDEDLNAEEFNDIFDFFFPYFDNGHIMGVIQNIIDPQMEVNKQYSTIVDILSRIAHGTIFYQKGAFSPDVEAELPDLLAKNAMAIPMEKLHDSRGDKLYEEKTAPTQISPIFERLITFNENQIKYIPGATDVMQGDVPRKQSGAAKRMDIHQSTMRLRPIISNFRAAIKREGKSYIKLIQRHLNTERIFRIYGDNMGETPEEITINKQTIDRVANDTTVGRYDIVMDLEEATPTERDSNFWKLVELMARVPLYADIIGRQAIKKFPLPEKDAILREWDERQQMLAQQAQMEQPNRGAIQSAPRPSQGARREPQRVQS